MGSNFHFLKTRRAAERSTDCNLFISSSVSPSSKLFQPTWDKCTDKSHWEGRSQLRATLGWHTTDEVGRMTYGRFYSTWSLIVSGPSIVIPRLMTLDVIRSTVDWNFRTKIKGICIHHSDVIWHLTPENEGSTILWELIWKAHWKVAAWQAYIADNNVSYNLWNSLWGWSVERPNIHSGCYSMKGPSLYTQAC